MDMEIVGRHALFFDDDAMAAFVNSDDALVEWHSLKIDRYDVRHLLSDPPPPRRRNRSYEPRASDDPSLDFLIEQERYLDLPLETDQPELEEEEKPSSSAGYRSVAFSYGNTDDSTDQKNTDVEMEASGYRPPFSVPGDIVQSLMLGAGCYSCDLRLPYTGTFCPFDLMAKGCAGGIRKIEISFGDRQFTYSDEKVHQIIARTAAFVSKHGGQSEIILRVKQGDNPTFGFLMPDHHLHAYFRYLVDHPELVQAGIDEKSQDETKTAGSEHNYKGSVGGALSLLGSVYGSGEDEDGDDVVNASLSNDSKNVESAELAMKDESASRKPILSKKDKVPAVKKNSSILGSRSKGVKGLKKEDNSGLFSSIEEKLKNHGIGATSIQIPEPPPEMKRMIDKLVEFVMRNGKQFEATILEQDSKLERFSFLIPSNQYHPYYLKALQAAEESKVNGKGYYPGQEDQSGHGIGKRASGISCSTSEFGDVPFESDRKEKFKMVLGKSKKEAQETEKESQESGFTVDAAAAAAILQAAAKGIKSTGLHIMRSASANSHGAVGGAVSTDAKLTEEQKLKAERLKKAKMFVAMLKSGALPSRTGTSRGSSAEPIEPGILKSVREVNRASQERESSLAPVVVDTTAAKSNFNDRLSEQRSKRKYRSRSVGSDDEEEDSRREGHSRSKRHKEDYEVGNAVEKDRKHRRRRHRSHSSSEESENGEESDKHDAKLKHHKSKHRSRHSHPDDDERGGTYKEERDEEHRKSSSRRSTRQKSSRYDDKNGTRDKVEEDKHHKRKHSAHSSEDNGGESTGDDKDDRSKEEKDHKRSRKKHRSSHTSRHSRHKHKHRSARSSKDKESHHRHKHDTSDDEYHHHRANSDRPEKQVHDVTTELEEGEIGLKVSPDESKGITGGDGKRGSSVDVMSSQQRAPSQPSETTEVPADLRAKIRAMLMAARS